MTVKILEPFKPIIELKYKYYIYHSGRGCGKSDNILMALILLVYQHGFRVLCVREYQSSIGESVKAGLEVLIEKSGLSQYFKSTVSEITCVNGGKFIFRGLRSSNAVNIKSIHDINVTFIEEAEALSEKSWELLVPSVMRASSGINIIIAALNPNFEEDVIWDRFIIKDPPPMSYVRKLTQEDNPFFFDTDLPNQMAHDKKILPYSQFAHKWLGELQTAEEDCLFTKEGFDYMKQPFTVENFVRIVIGVDPAMTNKDFSNQFGICVVGITQDGQYICLGNYTDNHSPHSFSIAVRDLYKQYEADAVVVETNAGGDFIKSTLLLADTSMNVVEVRATRDKMTRALPIANLASLDKIRLADIGRAQLIRQMKCSTITGYKGPVGESPDALDAFCWAVYYLGELLDKEQVATVFTSSMFTANANDYPMTAIDKAHFTLCNETEGCILTYSIKENTQSQRCYVINKCEVFNFVNFVKTFDKLENYVFIPDSLNVELSWCSLYEPSNLKLDELVGSILPIVSKTNVDLRYHYEDSTHKNFTGNILLRELDRFKLDTQKDNLIIRTLCNFMLLV